MTPDRKYGKAELGPINILPELTWDMFEGKPIPPGLGKTETPVTVLPEMACDFASEDTTPVLQLSVCLRPEAIPVQIALDLFRLYAAVHQLELSLGGRGLIPSGHANGTPAGTSLSVTFKPTDPTGAADRLASL